MRLFTLFSSFLIGTAGMAQHFCHTTEMQNDWFQKNPQLKTAYEARRQEVIQRQNALNSGENKPQKLQPSSAAAAGTFTIPLVFHILHVGGSENISDAQVQDAVSILNRDYNKLNSDTTDVVGPFKNLVGNAQIEFRLATKDPNGNCTNGIIRHWDANTNWDKDFSRYVYTWPAHKYLNIYVIKSMEDAAGYTFLPGSGIPSYADAIVILSTYVGSIGTGHAGTSRALTHEVGHWLGLEHTWGFTNQPGVSCGDDGIFDTPVTKGFSGCNLANAAICNPPIIENMQNYMDYAYCHRMFTSGQCFEMQSTMNSSLQGRNNLTSPSNLFNTGVTSQGTGCVPLMDISALPSLTICSGKPLTLLSFTSNANPGTYLWLAGGNASITSPNAGSTTITFASVGPTTITCTASNASGSVSKTLYVLVKNGTTDVAGAYSESFETNTLPASWNVVNVSGGAGHQWQSYTGAGSHGVQCMYVPGEILPANTVQILEAPSFDFKNNPGLSFTFKYAYSRKNTANKDVFKVQVSKDCGGTWSDIWAPGTAGLAAPSGGVNPLLLVPFDEWVLYDLTAHPAFNSFKNEANLKIRFYFQEDPGGSGFGNRIYLDEINFKTPTGINELSRSLQVNLYPNPANGETHLEFTLSDASTVSCELRSIDGGIVMAAAEQNLEPGAHNIQINKDNGLAPGIYFVNLEVNGVTFSRKLVIE